MRTLIVGYGNPSRQDDGVGLAVVNGLCQRLGLPVLDESPGCSEVRSQALDVVFLQQLTPDLSERLSGYDRAVFVDAHGDQYEEPIRRVIVQPEYEPSRVSHQFSPGQLLAMARDLYGSAPQAELVSVRGFRFDFGSTLSPVTAESVSEVVTVLWDEYGPRGDSIPIA